MSKSFSKFLTVGLVLLSVFSAPAFASPISNNDLSGQPEDPDIVVHKPVSDSLFAGLDMRSYKYEEPGFVTHTGLMYGPWFEYITNTSMGLIGTKGNILFGALKYDGALCDSSGNCTPYSTSNQKDTIANANFDYFIKTNSNFTGKVGLGYRYLYDTVSETGFYQRTGSWLYIPFGLLIDAPLQDSMKMQFDFAYSFVFYGGIKSNLSEVSSQYSDIYSNQNGTAINAGASIVFSKAYKLGFYYEQWDLNESNMSTTGGLTVVEPKNNSKSFGARFGYNFF
ncbi:MAG: hypothetical protein ACXWQQ_01390 [Pseudobdellovibrio sp.]